MVQTPKINSDQVIEVLHNKWINIIIMLDILKKYQQIMDSIFLIIKKFKIILLELLKEEN